MGCGQLTLIKWEKRQISKFMCSVCYQNIYLGNGIKENRASSRRIGVAKPSLAFTFCKGAGSETRHLWAECKNYLQNYKGFIPRKRFLHSLKIPPFFWRFATSLLLLLAL